ncbi:recombinase zinc beta ribbon domain-containing protein [Clostridium algidicarnis]|uniref:recombinase zinc beta ribbon domain-containing protein n=1 Tax=Clostridium algidicarnis TaxID=37659 RepID=UPI00311A9AEE
MLVCVECGHPYRRQVWSKYGQKSAVWRCKNRLKMVQKQAVSTHLPLRRSHYIML